MVSERLCGAGPLCRHAKSGKSSSLGTLQYKFKLHGILCGYLLGLENAREIERGNAGLKNSQKSM